MKPRKSPPQALPLTWNTLSRWCEEVPESVEGSSYFSSRSYPNRSTGHGSSIGKRMQEILDAALTQTLKPPPSRTMEWVKVRVRVGVRPPSHTMQWATLPDETLFTSHLP